MSNLHRAGMAALGVGWFVVVREYVLIKSASQDLRMGEVLDEDGASCCASGIFGQVGLRVGTS